MRRRRIVSTLLLRASIVMLDGNPQYPDLGAQWQLAERTQPTLMGAGPALLMGCRKAGLQIGREFDLGSIRQLCAAGARVDLTPTKAAERMVDASIGWAYVDQSAYCPKLHELVALRGLIGKRPGLSTIEVLIGPVRGRRGVRRSIALVSGHMRCDATRGRHNEDHGSGGHRHHVVSGRQRTDGR